MSVACHVLLLAVLASPVRQDAEQARGDERGDAPGATAQEPAVQGEVLREDLPDGGRVERTIVRSVDGAPISHGPYREWHANGQLAAEGACLDGARDGEWVHYHEGGGIAARGTYRDGRRVGKWESFHPGGAPESEGVYRRGLRFGKWTCLDESGVKTGDSGDYEARFLAYPDGARMAEGSLRVGKRHGPWIWYARDGSVACTGSYRNGRRDGTWTWSWPDGTPRLRGEYRRDERTGDWIFHHPGGIPDPGFLSGRFERDRRVGPPADPPSHPDAAALVLPAPAPHPELTGPDRRRVAALVQRFVEGTDAQQRDALAGLVEWEVAALPEALAALAALDLSDREQALTAYRVNFVLLAQITGGHLLPWVSGFDAQAGAANRLTLLRWLTLWELTRDDAELWERVRASEADPEGAFLVRLLDERELRPLDAVADESLAAASDAAGEPPPLRAELLAQHGGAGTQEALEAALAWLVAHQDEDGKWDADGFERHCAPGEGGGEGGGDAEAEGAAELAPCTGHGWARQDVGLTGLCVLALLGGGTSGAGGPYAEPVRRAVAWLRGVQDPRTGLIGGGDVHAFVYDHAIATLALCEAARGAQDPLLESQVQVAVDAIQRMRNPGAAWRYDREPRGENDTSVTAWMVSALAAARAGGYRVDEAAFEGALAWIDRATDETNGRIGYDAKGSFSARTADNQSYPREAGEAMTAAGLWVRLLCGQRPDQPLLARHVALLLERLPAHRPEALTNDLYYWYYGTYALFQVGRPAWDLWNHALKEALLAWQSQGGHAAGSFDPLDAWGFACGRVGTTAFAALCLEAYFRLPRFAR